MADQNQNKNGLPPTPGNSPNWGLWILMAVITGILLLAFTSDGSMGSPSRSISLEDFRKDYRSGKVVLTDPEHYPIEVISNDSSSNGRNYHASAPQISRLPRYRRRSGAEP